MRPTTGYCEHFENDTKNLIAFITVCNLQHSTVSISRGVSKILNNGKDFFVFLQPKFQAMKTLYTILLLVASNIFMTFAWYGNLKLTEMGVIKDWPLILIILASWGVAFFEYSIMVPANRIGSDVNGGPFNIVQLKVIQEVVSLIVFMIITIKVFKMSEFSWNHLLGFFFMVLAVYFCFKN